MRTGDRRSPTVAIIGAGLGGIAAAVNLKRSGVTSFTISPPVGKFRSIGTLSVSDQMHEGDEPVFSGRNSGGNIRPLPPVSFY